MPSWEPDPTRPARQLPLFGRVVGGARRGANYRLVLNVVVIAWIVVVVAVDGRPSLPEVLLLAYVCGRYLRRRVKVFLSYLRVQPLLAEKFVAVEVVAGQTLMTRRHVAVRLPDGRRLTITARSAWPPLVAQARLWMVHRGDRALVLLPGGGFLRARIRDEPLRHGTRPPEPGPDPWEVVRRSGRRHAALRRAGEFAVMTGLLVWTCLGFPNTESGYFIAAVVLAVVMAALTLWRLRAAIGLERPKVWTEFTVAPDPVITVRRQLRVEGRGELADGTPVSFVVPNAGLMLGLEFASAGRLWTTGKWVRPNVGRRRIHIQRLNPASSRLQAPGPLPDHDHA